MVLLPDPDGAEKMMSLPCVPAAAMLSALLSEAVMMVYEFYLQCIEHLFLDLFELVFHLHHNILHLCLVALRACSVDFAPHLLCYEAELLAHGTLFGHRLTEVFQVIGKALLLLTDVEFLDVVDEFLLQAVLLDR